MKAVSSRPVRTLQPSTRLRCIDNTGAKELQIISVRGYKGTRRKRATAGVGDVITCSVTRGDAKLVHTVVQAIVVRQRKEWRRPSGLRIAFSDNAAVLIDEKFEPKGKEIKGAIAKEAVERFSRIGKIASAIL